MRYLDDFPVVPINNLWTDTGSGISATTRSTSFRRNRRSFERCILMATDPGDLVLDPTCGSGTTAYCRRAMGPPLDHDRHLARGAGAGPCPHHGRALSVLPAGRFPRRPAQGSRGHPHRAEFAARAREHPPRLRLRARAAHHAQVHRQQRGDRCHLGAVAGDSWSRCARS